MTKLVAQLKREEQMLAVDKISSGNTTFFTKLGWLVIRLGARIMPSENMLKTINPENNIKANSNLEVCS